MSKLRENFQILGKYLDIAELASIELLEDLFPDVTENFIEDYERVYKLDNSGTDEERRNRIVSAMRQRGGLSKDYFEAIGNKLGDGLYTVIITEGSGGYPFIVAPAGPESSPDGPATLVPGEVNNGDLTNTPYHITVSVFGVASAPDLEKLYNRLKPAWTVWEFVYTP